MTESDLPVGGELFGYRIEGVLGRGGMGVVYLAEDLRLRRRVALKLLAPALAGDELFRNRFLAESKLAASLDHPCVVPIYAAGEGDGLLVIAMRYVEGSDLKTLLRGGLVSAERAIRVCAQVADALDFAHRQGLVHRDVKPSNVLLDGKDHAYLADFGLTRRLAEPQAAEPGLLGTIDYIAPEQIRGEKVEGRADQYSLGCLLCECLMGQPPFPRSTDTAVLFAHLEEQPAAPVGLEAVMATALAKKPADRYPTCGEFVAAAAAALGLGEHAGSLDLPFLLAGVRCPFKGLASFERSDAQYFCGREPVVSEVVARLAVAALVGILGPSGIGKSSVLRAGVLPALSAGVLPGSEAWRQVLLRPGAQPCAELSRVLDGRRLDATTRGLAAGERIVVAVDQLEELFTACEGEWERLAFLEQLATAAGDHDRRALVVVSLRADFYGRLASYPAFAQLISSSHVLVSPMGREEVARAIEEPTSRAGLEIEPALVDALVSDVAGEPGGLPLLSTMLLELWRARDGRTLGLETYRTSGGVRGAVARLAERACGQLDERERGVVRNMMLRLVGGDDVALVRRRVPLSELQQMARAERVLRVLTDARLLTVSDGEVEVSHEALLREWPRGRAWLEEDRVGRRLHAHLIETARDWDTRGRDPGDLYRGTRLAGALDWAALHGDELNPLEREFLDASKRDHESGARRQRTQNRRLRRLTLGTVGLLAVSITVGVIALVKGISANHAADAATAAARTALGRELGAEAVNEPQMDLAMLLGREAVNLDRSPATQGNLLSTLVRSPTIIQAFALPTTFPVGMALSPDNRTLAIADSSADSSNPSNKLWFFDLRRHVQLRPPLSDYSGDQPPAYSTDGSLLVYSAEEPIGQTVYLAVRNAHTLALVATLPLESPRAGGSGSNLVHGTQAGILISPDRRSVYDPYSLTDATGRVTRTYLDRWSLPNGRLLSTTIGDGPLFALGLIDRGTRLVAFAGRRVRVFDAKSLRLIRTMSLTRLFGSTTTAAVSPDGRTLVVGSQAGSLAFVNLSTGAMRVALAGHNGSVEIVRYSADGRTLVSVGGPDSALVWNPKTAAPLEHLNGPAALLDDAAISREGKTLYTLSADGVVFGWDLTGERGFVRRFGLGGGRWTSSCVAALLPYSSSNPRCDHVLPVNPPLAISPDGARLAVRLGPARVGVFSAGTLSPQESFTIRPRADLITALAWSPSGQQLAVAGHSGLVQMWRLDGRPRLVRSLVGLHPLLGLPEAIQALAFSPDGKLLAASNDAETRARDPGTSGGPLATVAIWRTSSGILIVPPRDLGAGAEVNGVGDILAFSPNGKVLAVGGSGSDVLVLDARTGQIDRALHTNNFETSLAFAPDGRLALGSFWGTVQLWNPTSGKPLTTAVRTGLGLVTSIAFDPTGQRFATTGAGDGTITVWSTSTLEQEGPALDIDPGATATVAFQPRGAGLLAVNDQGVGFRWPMALSDWEQRACQIAGRNLTREEWARFVIGRPYTHVCP